MNLYNTLKQIPDYIGKIARPFAIIVASTLPINCTTVEIDLIKSYENLQGMEKKLQEQYNTDSKEIHQEYSKAVKLAEEEKKGKLKTLNENFDKAMEKYKLEKQGLEKAVEQLHNTMKIRGNKK